VGHFSAVCRAAVRDRQRQRNAEWHAASSYAHRTNTNGPKRDRRRCTTVVWQPVHTDNYIAVRIWGKTINCLIDTGSVTSIVSDNLTKRLRLCLKPLVRGDSNILFSASGTSMPVIATTKISMCFSGFWVTHLVKIVSLSSTVEITQGWCWCCPETGRRDVTNWRYQRCRLCRVQLRSFSSREENGSKRLVVDLRGVNHLIAPKLVQLPKVSELIDYWLTNLFLSNNKE